MALHGYPDYQPPGVVIPSAGESPVLETVAAAERVGKHVGETLETSQYSYLRLHVTPDTKGGVVIVTVEWFTDPELTRPAGTRVIPVSPTGEGPEGDLFAHIGNLGPFARLTLASSKGELAGWNASAEVIADNRNRSVEAVAAGPVLIPVYVAELASAATHILYPRFYWSGPALAAVIGVTYGLAQVSIEVWDPVTKAWIVASTNRSKGVNLWETVVMQTPLGAWRLQLGNESPNGTQLVGVSLVPSFLGAS